MINPRNFIINSDFPMDIVVYIKEVDVLFGSDGIDVPHNLRFAPLITGICSTDNWSTMTPIDMPSGGSSTNNVSSESTRDKIKLINYGTQNQSVKVRLFGLAPSNTSIDVAPPKTRYSNFNINTDYNYSKLIKAGIYNVVWNIGERVIYNHNLGYIPEVEVWAERSGVISRLLNLSDPHGINFSSGGNRITYIKITENDLIARFDGNKQDIQRIHYRIYGDANG